MIKKLLELYGKWRMKRSFEKFSKAWQRAEAILKKAGWTRQKRRQLRRKLIKGSKLDWSELE